MSIFDRLKQSAVDAAATAATAIGNKRETFTFTALPESLAQMQALSEAALDTPFQTAALTVLALCAYAADRQIGTDMLNWLRGPRPLNGQEISFLNDRFRDGKTYLPFTYFAGSTPDNNYTPTQPYTIRVESNHVSGEEQGYMKLFIPCGGADSPRPIKLRQRGEMVPLGAISAHWRPHAQVRRSLGVSRAEKLRRIWIIANRISIGDEQKTICMCCMN